MRGECGWEVAGQTCRVTWRVCDFAALPLLPVLWLGALLDAGLKVRSAL